MQQNKINELIEDLSDRKYWDIRHIQPHFTNVCRVETRMEYDRETCEEIIKIILRAFQMNLQNTKTQNGSTKP